ncbi:MAG TPA: GerMN domain-containing protein [Clostridia bacterium]|nr:GerMN domain-containing protein [Clostridia bacterium]
MKRTAYICIVTLFVTLISGCGGINKPPEGLIKKDIVDDSEDADILDSLSAGDSENEEDHASPVIRQNASLYFWDKENNKLVSESRKIVATDMDSFVGGVVEGLLRGPQSEELQPVIPSGTTILDIQQIDNIVNINLSGEFLDAEDLLVARTALVNTLTEQEKIKYVKINIDGRELTRDGTADTQSLGVLVRSTNNINELVAAQGDTRTEDNVKEINWELFFRDFRGRYLLSEIRPISVKNGGIARAIIEELIKGPIGVSEGLYPVIPQGTQLLDIKLTDDDDGEPGIVALYFSKELKAPFTEEGTSRSKGKEKDPQEVQVREELNKNRESIILSSIVYNLQGINNIDGVKIFYQNRYGDYVDTPLCDVDLTRILTTRDFSNKLGRKIKIYFANANSTHLIPEYRAMSRENVQIAKTIIDELILGPREDTDQVGIIPPEISMGDIRVWMDTNNTTVMVDLPKGLDGNKMGSTGALMTLYAMVNSLTDPVNTSNIKEVQFLVGGKTVKTFGNLEFGEPFIRNPAIIQE